MKITKIETLVCHARMRNWVFVKVLTDQDGLFGWGEATLEWHTRAVVGAVADIAELVVGEDPTRPEHLWQMMHRQHFWHGHGRQLAVQQALGRAGPRSHPHLLPPGRRPHGGFL
jgi:galactonate dehydratase